MSAAPDGQHEQEAEAEGQKDHEEKQSDGGGIDDQVDQRFRTITASSVMLEMFWPL